jgi:ribonuclease J
LREHAAFARGLGINDARVVADGAALKLAPGEPEIVGQVQVGRLGLDGKRLVPLEDELLAERRRMNFAGFVFVSVGLDSRGRLADRPQITLRGLATGAEEADLADDIEAEIERVIERRARRRWDEERLSQDLRLAVRRVASRSIGKKPVTEVHVFRL